MKQKKRKIKLLKATWYGNTYYFPGIFEINENNFYINGPVFAYFEPHDFREVVERCPEYFNIN